jgi:late competence protein required for DNA uptake (superfamily II DNA/RNA helicase)
VEQVYYEVDRRYKIDLLTRLIDIHDLKLGIIFCNTKRMVDDLVDHLEAQGYMADRLHGDMTQAQRDRVMGKFRKSGLEFLVATDIAARGIDVDDVQVCLITICLTTRRIMCIASAAPAAPAAAVGRFHSPPAAKFFRSATSSASPTCGFSAENSDGRRSPRSPRECVSGKTPRTAHQR